MRCRHSGQAVPVSNAVIYAGGLAHLSHTDLSGFDVLIALTEHIPAWLWQLRFRGRKIWSFPIADYDGATGPLPQLLEEVIQKLTDGSQILVFCDGGHGRTGMFLASLISATENPPDPIATMRERYCVNALETREQAETAFSLTEHDLPSIYHSLPTREEILNMIAALRNQKGSRG